MTQGFIADDPAAITACYQHAPHWKGIFLGPVPFGRPPNERISLHIQVLFSHSLEEAVEDAWNYVRSACTQFNYPFDADEWDLVYLQLVNAN